MQKQIVIHHSADFDGIFCREIARKFLPGAQLIGWDYGQPVPVLPNDCQLYLLDISIDAHMKHPNLVWIDHHKSEMDKFGARAGYQIDGVAACRLAWQWFSNNFHTFSTPDGKPVAHPLPVKEHFVDRVVGEPFAVRLAGEYDIWDKRDERAELFQHGLRSQELTDKEWADMLNERSTVGFANTTVQVLLMKGKAVQYAKTAENASIIKDIGFDLNWEGLKFLACNAARYNSALFTAGLKAEHDACFGFKWTGNDWSVSLYHAPGKEHHDLSVIASKYGGGGHRGACGFRTMTLPFLPQ